MTIVGTAFGANIIAMPAHPGLRSVDFGMMDSVGTSTSPWSLQSHYYPWAGSDLWSATCTLPPMPRASAAPWIAWLAALKGKGNCFLLGDPAATSPMGSASGSPVVAAGNTVSSSSLLTSGWTASTTGLLLPGDYITVTATSDTNPRLHMVLDQANSDSGGNCILNIWPSLREVPGTGLPVQVTDTVGLFKLADTSRQYSSDYTRVVAISFRATEFR